MKRKYDGTTGKLIEVKDDKGKILYSKREELKKAQKEVIDQLKNKGKVTDTEAKEIKEKLKGGE